MDDTVLLFNRLDRSRETPSRLPNHWFFGVRQNPRQPHGDRLFVFHPTGNFLQCKFGQILSLPSISKKAEALLPLLLDVFIKGCQTVGGVSTSPYPYAPWTWATEDPELAKALEKCLKQHGIASELCSVGICSEILPKEHLQLCRALERIGAKTPAHLGDHTRCHGCRMGSRLFPKPLEMCSRCGKAWYHSQDCRRKNWNNHMRDCLWQSSIKVNFGPTSSSTRAAGSYVDAHTFHNIVARSSPQAQALMRTLHLNLLPFLSFPTVTASTMRIRQTLQSLVYVGKDTPESMQILFGRDWRGCLDNEHDMARIEVLLDPPRGSYSYTTLQWLYADGSLKRSPRPATEAEQQVIRKVREMQVAFRQRFGSTGRPPSVDDKVKFLGGQNLEWTSHGRIYKLACGLIFSGDGKMLCG